jgi:hypothetical protein
VKNIITLFGVHKKFPPDPPPLNEAYRLTIADFGASTSRDMRYGYKKHTMEMLVHYLHRMLKTF